MSTRKLRLAFMSPPHADWQTPANLTWMLLESHYNHEGKYPDKVEFIPAIYKFDKYTSWQEMKDDMDQGEPADVYCFGSYIWNYNMCDKVAEIVKKQNPNAICVIGGPHIGKNEPELIAKRLELYDYICQTTKPGEAFFNSLIDGYFDEGEWPEPENVTWEWRSTKGEVVQFPDYSVYEEHSDYLKEMSSYAMSNHLEPYMAIESTRGCPYSCTFCEWGGGIGTKVYQKSMDVWKKDVIALQNNGYRDAYLCDANFGAFKDRDIEIFRWSFERGFNLTDISTMKAKSLQRRKDLVDAWFDVIGPGEEKHSEVFVPEQGSHALFFMGSADDRMKKEQKTLSHQQLFGADGDKIYVSVVPTVSIQSVSDDAMKIAKRVDLNLDDKIALSEHIYQRCNVEGYPKPPVEMILGMPGSTIDDFYKEYEIYWNFKSFGSWRHDYMFLPDSELTNPDYIEKYKIETVECYTDVIEEGGAQSRHNLYNSHKTRFKTIASCFSYTREEMHEMWFMNVAGNILLERHYATFENIFTPGEFCRICYDIIKNNMWEFQEIHKNIVDILNPDTPPRGLKKIIKNRSRLDCIMDLVSGNNEYILLNELFKRGMLNAS